MNSFAQSKDASKKEKRLNRLEKYQPVDVIIQQLVDDRLMPLVKDIRVTYPCRGMDPRQTTAMVNPNVEIQGYTGDFTNIHLFRAANLARLETLALNRDLRGLWHRF